MKVLLDEMLPIGVRRFLPGHEVVTATYADELAQAVASIAPGLVIRLSGHG